MFLDVSYIFVQWEQVTAHHPSYYFGRHCISFLQMIFDPNMTKKKKKKKKPFMLDEEGGEGMGGEEVKEVEMKEAEPEAGEDKELDLDDDDGRKKGSCENKKKY